MLSIEDLSAKLKEIFGYDSFRPGQLEVIEQIINNKDVLSVMPTGAGKSLCFQLPAVLRDSQTIVVSPLVALMNDQVAALKDSGINAEMIHSGRTREENIKSWKSFASGEAKILYLSPERLMQPRMLSALAKINIGLFVIDEAHCISKWGAGFRPDYEALSSLRGLFPKATMAAFTATADSATRKDIASKLSAGKMKIILKGFDRPNLSLAVYPKQDTKKKLLEFLKPRQGQSGIIYCLSRKETENTAEFLNEHGLKAIAYHAGKSSKHRQRAQDRFMTEDGIIMTATIAFGMGIDKPDIRFVVHINLPGSVEAFYQEIGRAGRDGNPSETVMFYGLSDLISRQRMIFEGEGSEQFKLLEYKRLEALLGYCEASLCRRMVLLAYFDEKTEACGNCDNCLKPPKVEDYSKQAKLLFLTIQQTNQYFGVNHIIDVLRGAETAKIKARNHQLLSCFGTGANYPKYFFQSLVRQLVAAGILKVNLEKYGSIQLTQEAKDILDEKKSFMTKLISEKQVKSQAKSTARVTIQASSLSASNTNLLMELKKTRLAIAREKEVPAFVVFPDRSLIEMAEKQPQTKQEFLDINGVGQKKLEEYFTQFVSVISNFSSKTSKPNDSTLNQSSI